MGGAHSSENRWTLGFQGGRATPRRKAQRWSSLDHVDRRHQTGRGEPLDTSGPESWSLERPTKDLCPSVGFYWLI
ncbi:jg11765 [Pararge aegeria aegeria]|uniref:Jg11765 protein n=1 Tax=Pararge aegeria aegeria TaxID=348720 RepID=A0A8S4S2Z9_9NEOP|nr:jg11765 [Pararge aegeria aegeria]